VRSLTGRPFLLLVLAIVLAAGAAAAILASASLLGREQALMFAIAAVAIALGAAWLPFRALNRRFGSVADAARSMAEGDLARRVPIDGHDPLGQLSRCLNDIAARFESKLHELQEGRDSSRSILGNIPFGLALVGKDLLIRHANSRFWEMLALDRPSGDERLAAARQPVLEEMALHVFHHRKSIIRDVALHLDQRREYEVRVSPIGAYAGAADAILLSLEDLGPEKAAAALRREFVANASHELKTPLTSIRGYAETLLSGGLEDEVNRTRFVETIRDQASRLEALVEDLLELADLERADAPLDLKDWDLAEITRDVASTYEEVASRRGLRLSLEGTAGLHARVDRKRLELALRNLLDNAIKYTERGSVSVRVEEHGDAIRVCVADTGRGVAAEHLPRVFERFYRVDRGRSRALGGTGLGLSIVKHAVQLHGGHVGVESEAGQGSTFWIEVPREGPDDGAPSNGA
jgi:two-component system, OmpR family, phosphate regulon sensor histidine kinase PhoR